jgi:hypothetical protein
VQLLQARQPARHHREYATVMYFEAKIFFFTKQNCAAPLWSSTSTRARINGPLTFAGTNGGVGRSREPAGERAGSALQCCERVG